MKKTRTYAGELLKTVCQRMRCVSENVYAMHRPMAAGEQMKDMVVVSLGSALVDEGPYQRTDLRVDIIVRDKGQKISDMTRLQEMADETFDLFPIIEGRYRLTRPRMMLKGSDGEGFTVWIVYANVYINTTDRLEHE